MFAPLDLIISCWHQRVSRYRNNTHVAICNICILRDTRETRKTLARHSQAICRRCAFVSSIRYETAGEPPVSGSVYSIMHEVRRSERREREDVKEEARETKEAKCVSLLFENDFLRGEKDIQDIQDIPEVRPGARHRLQNRPNVCLLATDTRVCFWPSPSRFSLF